MVPNEPLAPGLVADQAGPGSFGRPTTEAANEPASRRPPAPVRSLHDRTSERTGPPTSSGACSVTPRPKRRTNRPSDDLRRLFGHSTTEAANEPALRRPPAPVRALHDRSAERTAPPTPSGARPGTPRPHRRTRPPPDAPRRPV